MMRTFLIENLLLLLAAVAPALAQNSKFEAGLALYHSGRIRPALDEFIASESAGEANPLRDFYRGVCLAKLGDWPEASARLLVYVSARPSDQNGWYWLSRAQLLQRQFSEARTSIQRSLNIAPKSYEALRTQGEIELELRNNDAAYRAWIAANRLNPRDAQTTYYLGRLFYEADFPNEAAVWLKETLRLAATHFSAMTYLALCAEQLADNDTALRLYREAIHQSKLQKAPFAWAFLSYAKLLRQSGNDNEALAVLEESEKTCPEAHALSLLGHLLAAHQQTARAEAVLRRAIQMDSSISEAHYHLSLLLRSSARIEEAQAEINRFKETKEIEERNRNKISAIRK
jgi:tetratricopeptide (TPR) repeat protein